MTLPSCGAVMVGDAGVVSSLACSSGVLSSHWAINLVDPSSFAISSGVRIFPLSSAQPLKFLPSCFGSAGAVVPPSSPITLTSL